VREIHAWVAVLPGPWVIDVTVDSEFEGASSEVSLSLFLGHIDHAAPCFIVRRAGRMIRVSGHYFGASEVMHSSTVGEFATMGAACEALHVT
jgi:hypothetical protein